MAGSRGASAQPFVAWLEEAVAARGSSFRRVAAESGVSASALSAIRTGKVGQPSMETCYRLAGYLKYDLGQVLRVAGYDVPAAAGADLADPELDLVFHGLLDVTPEERACVKEFARFVLARAAAEQKGRTRGR
ncbi:MAG TPA: helix-turn-helix transcriptional regulator [Chloroflexota bacterium]|nr:helix-turn-helix transcriptional regulator [Chloroflexota bacterium]